MGESEPGWQGNASAGPVDFAWPGDDLGPMKLRWLLGMVGLALVAPVQALGQATPYVPLGDPVYADLDALVDAGWVRGALLGGRPWSRLTVARYVTGARARLDGDSVGPPRARLREALERLERDFAPELRALCPAGGECSPLEPGARVRSASADATLANSKPRRIPTSYDWANSDYIDADLNPLLERNQGRVLADGGTIGVEGVLDVAAIGPFAAQLHPRVWALNARDAAADADVTLLEGYVRALLGNVAVEVGRNHIALGHGREAGPILSDNARGLDLLRFSLDRPARLPWKLAALGTLTASALAADMGGSQDTPHSKLVVFDVELRPHRLLELSAVLMNHQAGENSPPATFTQRLQDIFLIYPQGAMISDKVIGAGAALSLPSAGARLYFDVLTTDDHNLFTAETGEALGSEAVWIGGARVTGLGRDARVDLWAEGRRSGVRPHTHHQFTTGLTLDRRVIGDALGPLARSVAGGMGWRGSLHSLAVGAAWERYSNGDFYEQIPDDGVFAWERTRDAPDETRERLTFDWRHEPGPARVGVGARLALERATTFDFRPTRRSNAMLQLRLDYRW
jgi:hypothetical protein